MKLTSAANSRVGLTVVRATASRSRRQQSSLASTAATSGTDLVSFPGARLSCRSDLAYAEAGCQIRQPGHGASVWDFEPRAQVVPERDGVLGAGFQQAEEGIARLFAGCGARLAPDLVWGRSCARRFQRGLR